MAKKNRAGLLDNWISQPLAQEEEVSAPVNVETESSDNNPELEGMDELQEQLTKFRDSKRTGRPKGKKEPNPYEGRATFVVDMRLIRKLKYISLKETRLHKDVISEALSRYIDEWESRNGEINL